MTDLFRERAEAILSLAQMGEAEQVTILMNDNGPYLPVGLHLVMGDSRVGSGGYGAGTSAYRVTRQGETITVRGTQGGRACEVQAPVLRKSAMPILLNNQALYSLASGGSLLPVS